MDQWAALNEDYNESLQESAQRRREAAEDALYRLNNPLPPPPKPDDYDERVKAINKNKRPATMTEALEDEERAGAQVMREEEDKQYARHRAAVAAAVAKLDSTTQQTTKSLNKLGPGLAGGKNEIRSKSVGGESTTARAPIVVPTTLAKSGHDTEHPEPHHHRGNSLSAELHHPVDSDDDYVAHAANHPRSKSDAGPMRPPVNLKTGPVPVRRGSKKGPSSSMAAAMRGEEIAFGLNGGRNASLGNAMNLGSRNSSSPLGRTGLRSGSPSIHAAPSTFLRFDGASNRRSSDANRGVSGLNAASLPHKKRSHRGSGSSLSPEDGDYPNGGEDAVVSSDDDSSEDEDNRRGRRGWKEESAGFDAGAAILSTLGLDGDGPDNSELQKQIDLAEFYREQNKGGSKGRSRTAPPAIRVTGSSGSLAKGAETGVHPSTSFDQGGAPDNVVVVDSDEEADLGDIKKAQEMQMRMTKINSSPESQYCFRRIFRGDFGKMIQESEDGIRRVRSYLVATDLSDEAQYALEWTVGTVLRDGDTLSAIYCVDEDIGVTNLDHMHSTAADSAMMKVQLIAAAETTNRAPSASLASANILVPSRLAPARSLTPAGGGRSSTRSPMGRQKAGAEQERERALDNITNKVTQLLRKTRLQVQVVIEVMHCKEPKHLLTEIIDRTRPTLVILGSRGRSAVKGVVLGSFSNYLVAKSSSPVMVARKRLRKHAKYKRPPVKLANNLTGISARALKSAKID